MTDILCICGHPRIMHKPGYVDDRMACMISNEDPEYHYCTYQPDNLGYLEKRYDKLQNPL